MKNTKNLCKYMPLRNHVVSHYNCVACVTSKLLIIDDYQLILILIHIIICYLKLCFLWKDSFFFYQDDEACMKVKLHNYENSE